MYEVIVATLAVGVIVAIYVNERGNRRDLSQEMYALKDAHRKFIITRQDKNIKFIRDQVEMYMKLKYADRDARIIFDSIINGESVIDDIVDRIQRKQLG